VKGRKQYRYHNDWSTARSENKFDKLPAFSRALPKLRDKVEHDLGLRGVCRDKVLATAVRLLEITLIRVGNSIYAKQNRSYGLTTLHKRHLEVDGSALTFEFRGKSGKDHSVSVKDRRLARVVRELEGLPGQQLFKYRTADGDLCPVDSDDVNAYIREAMGEQFSAKDFRTWAGTVSAARALRDTEPRPRPPTPSERSPSASRRWRACWAIPRPSAAPPMSTPRSSPCSKAAKSRPPCRGRRPRGSKRR
jgi:DNA topoisomerase I